MYIINVIFIYTIIMLALGVTMVGILNYEEIKLREKEIEVRALVALLEHGNFYYSNQAQRRLFEIAMPDIVAEEIEQETL